MMNLQNFDPPIALHRPVQIWITCDMQLGIIRTLTNNILHPGVTHLKESLMQCPLSVH